MTAVTRAFVVGHPVAHSRSPLLHGHWLRTLGLPGRYDKVDVAPAALPRFIATIADQGFAGGNVTVPHKQTVMSLVDDLDDAAQAVGAVNTLWFEGGKLRGGNTDAIGFLASLDDEVAGWDASARSATVLGAGGAARAIVYALLSRGLDVRLVNRSSERAESLSQAFSRLPSVAPPSALPDLLPGTDILVNTTSLGMAGKPPLAIDLSRLKRGATVSDIVYVPALTDLLRDAALRGFRTVGGVGMLLHQAVPGFARWFGRTPEVTADLRAVVEADL